MTVIRILAALSLLSLLAACGVDGAPKPPPPKAAPKTGIAISGEARMGVVKEL